MLEIYFEQNQSDKAIQWLTKASEHKNPEAMFTLGLYYLSHTDISNAVSLALKYLNMAAESGYKPALVILSEIYQKGELVKQDIPKSREYINQYYIYSTGAIRVDTYDDDAYHMLFRNK